MCATNWRGWQSSNAVHQRAGGRRRINAERKARAQKRREAIRKLIGDAGIMLCGGGSGWGWGRKTLLANHFGVSRSTICRDVAALQAAWRKQHVCSFCHTRHEVPLKDLSKLAKRGLWDGCTAQRCKIDVLIERMAASRAAMKV